jgi:hypothetical protein
VIFLLLIIFNYFKDYKTKGRLFNFLRHHKDYFFFIYIYIYMFVCIYIYVYICIYGRVGNEGTRGCYISVALAVLHKGTLSYRTDRQESKTRKPCKAVRQSVRQPDQANRQVRLFIHSFSQSVKYHSISTLPPYVSAVRNNLASDGRSLRCQMLDARCWIPAGRGSGSRPRRAQRHGHTDTNSTAAFSSQGGTWCWRWCWRLAFLAQSG